MKMPTQSLASRRVPALAVVFLLGFTVNAVWSQTYDPFDWYGDRAGYLDDYDDVNDYFYDDDVYDPNDRFNDDFYDHGYAHEYESRYFSPNDARRWDDPRRRGYAPYPPRIGPNQLGTERYYGPHTYYDGRDGLYERPSGYNNYYFDDNDFEDLEDAYEARGSDYFTNDWYEDNGAFDEWY